MAKITKAKMNVNIVLSVLVLVVFTCGPFLGVFMVERVNGWLSDGYEYDQIENVTAFYTGPFLEDKADDEYRYASVNGTGSSATVTSETPLWDSVSEWDQVTITSTGSDVQMIFNMNLSTSELLKNTDYQLRMRFNGSKAPESFDMKIGTKTIHKGGKTVQEDLTAEDVFNAIKKV